MYNIEDLLQKVKDNLIISFSDDDSLLESNIVAAVDYAEKYQHVGKGYYLENDMEPNTENAIIMMASHLYESRDGSTGGFFSDSVQAGDAAFRTIDKLLRLDRDWQV